MSKKTRNERNVGDYSGKDEITHAYDIPDTFIGSCKPEEFETDVLNLETKRQRQNSILTLRTVDDRCRRDTICARLS